MRIKLARILEELREDHRNLSRLLDLLEAECSEVPDDGEPDMELLRDIMCYMTVYPDAIHHPREDLVYAAMREHGLTLQPSEARRVAELLGRDPTLTEMTLFDTMWSEHCSYKSSRPHLKAHLPTTGENVVVGPVEDAGVVDFGEIDGKKYGIIFAHESHNHPSAIEPYGGAGTGIGGDRVDHHPVAAPLGRLHEGEGGDAVVERDLVPFAGVPEAEVEPAPREHEGGDDRRDLDQVQRREGVLLGHHHGRHRLCRRALPAPAPGVPV